MKQCRSLYTVKHPTAVDARMVGSLAHQRGRSVRSVNRGIHVPHMYSPCVQSMCSIRGGWVKNAESVWMYERWRNWIEVCPRDERWRLARLRLKDCNEC